jgi:hypothetical protein
MPIIDSAKLALQHARRWGALGLFRLARSILSGSLGLYQRRKVSKSSLRVVVAAARCVEQAAAVLLLGPKRPRDWQDLDNREQNHDGHR